MNQPNSTQLEHSLTCKLNDLPHLNLKKNPIDINPIQHWGKLCQIAHNHMPCLTTQVDISNANGGSIVDTIQRQHRGCIWRNVAVGERVPRCLFSRTKTYLRLAMAPHHPSVQSDISRPRRTSRYMCFCSFLSSSLHGPKTVLPLHVHLLLPLPHPQHIINVFKKVNASLQSLTQPTILTLRPIVQIHPFIYGLFDKNIDSAFSSVSIFYLPHFSSSYVAGGMYIYNHILCILGVKWYTVTITRYSPR